MITTGCEDGLPDIPVELTFTYIPPAYSDATPDTLREMTDEKGMAYFKDVPAGSKFILKTKVKTMEKERKEPCRIRPLIVFHIRLYLQGILARRGEKSSGAKRPG